MFRRSFTPLWFVPIVLVALVGCTSEDDDPPATRVLLTVDRGSQSPASADISPSATGLSVLQLTLTAGPDEEVRVDSIRFTETGTTDASADITSLSLYVDADDDGAYSPAMDTVQLGFIAGGYSAGSTADFTSIARTISAGAGESWILVYDLAGSAGLDETFIATVAATGDVSAQGTATGRAAEVSGPPVTGDTMTVKNIGSLTVSAGTSMPPAANLPLPPTTTPMFQLRLTAGPVEDVDVTAITFTAGGSGNADTAISAVDLYIDVDSSGTLTGGDTAISLGGAFSGGTAQFSGLTETITAGAGNAEDWLVVCTFSAGSLNDTFSVSLAANGDLTATGATSSQSITPSGAPVTGNTMTLLNVGTLAVSRGTNDPVAGNLPIPPNGAPMLQLNLAAGSVEDVNVTAITFTAGGTGNANTAVSAVDLINDVDGSGTLTGGDLPIALGGVFSGGSVQFTGLTETITAGASNAEDWLVLCTFTGGNLSDTFNVSLAANGDVTATGAVSAASITPTGAPVTGRMMTLTAVPLVITTKRVPRGQSGVAYNFTLQVTGGISPYTWAAATPLPAGLSLNPSTGAITGTPTGAGAIFAVQVTDNGPPVQTDTQLLAIEVDPAGATYGIVPTSFPTISAAVAGIPNPMTGPHIIEIQDNATYTENVDITVPGVSAGGAFVTIRSKYDCLPTVQASNANDHVIDNQAMFTMVVIRGLKITGATGTGQCGIFMSPSAMMIGVYNCTLYNNDTAFDSSGFSTCSFVNNTVHGPKGFWMAAGPNEVILNNVVHATGAWAVQLVNLNPVPDYNVYHAPTGAVGYDGTSFYNTLALWQAAIGGEANSLSGNPNFVNPSGADFHLSATSLLAIDQGITGSNFLIDCEGYARGHGAAWDRGAYEKN